MHPSDMVKSRTVIQKYFHYTRQYHLNLYYPHSFPSSPLNSYRQRSVHWAPSTSWASSSLLQRMEMVPAMATTVPWPLKMARMKCLE